MLLARCHRFDVRGSRVAISLILAYHIMSSDCERTSRTTPRSYIIVSCVSGLGKKGRPMAACNAPESPVALRTAFVSIYDVCICSTYAYIYNTCLSLSLYIYIYIYTYISLSLCIRRSTLDDPRSEARV